MSKMTRFDIAPSSLPGCAEMAVAGAVRADERVFLSAGNALRADGTVAGPGDAAAQTHAALDRLEASLFAAGGSLANVTKLTTCIVDRGYRADVYRAIAERLFDSESAVSKHVGAIFAKLDLADDPAIDRRVSAALAYLAGGL